MTKKRVYLVDDELLALEELKVLLAPFEDLEIIGASDRVDQAIQECNELKPDLIFLDINMPGKDGFGFLESLEEVKEVIFVTAYDQFAIQAFEVNALDYLLKPLNPKRLAEAIQRFRQKTGAAKSPAGEEECLSADKKIFIKDGEKCWFVALNEVRMFESEGNYVRVYFQNFKPLILKSLNNLEDRLDHTFFRTNRKFVVNLRWVQSVENWFNGGLRLTLKDGTQVEVSRRQSARFREMLSL